MKLIRLAVIFAIIFLGSISVAAQTQPNLENGFKPYGSYHGSDIDSVNLHNGNLVVHIPLPFSYPQRGALAPKNVLRLSSKSWAAVPFMSPHGGISYYWSLGFGPGSNIAQIGTGIGLDNTLDLSLHRFLQYESGAGASLPAFTFGHYLTTWDGGVHQLHSPANAPLDATGAPLSYDAIDGSGYHIDFSNPDTSFGAMGTAVITDRHGNRYLADKWMTHCGKPVVNGSFSTDIPGLSDNLAERQYEIDIYNLAMDSNNITGEDELRFGNFRHAPLQDGPTISTVGSTSVITCSQASRTTSITDVNGNVINTSWSTASADTMGRLLDGISGGGDAPDFSGCLSPGHVTSAATIYNYAGFGTGGAMQVKVCSANFPIQTNFGVSGVTEYQNETTSQNGGNTSPAMITTVVFSDAPNWTGTRWTFNYDSYANLTDIGLPTGGSIHYDWKTVAQSNCGTSTTKARAVSARTVNDNNGHSFTWNYNWGATSSGVGLNIVTDPLNNDTAHTFSALDGPGGCTFYETTTQQYQGSSSGGELLKQIDTTYSTPTHFGDAVGGNGGLGNIVPLSIKTTIKPNSINKVSVVTRTYDQGPGNTRPIFGNILTEQVSDWGAGSPGNPLREIDTAYQWQQPAGSGTNAYLQANLVDLVARNVVKGGSCMLAETTYGYDETPVSSSGLGTSQQLTAAPNAVRGNETSVNRWVAPLSSCAQPPAPSDTVTLPSPAVSSQAKWYDSGMLYQSIDPLGHTTTHSYDSFYAGAYATQTCSPATNPGTVSHCVSGTYDFNTGLITNFTNENAITQASGNTQGDSAHTSSYSYDSMFRLTSAQAPPDPANGDPANGGARAQTSFNFSAPSVFPMTVQLSKSVTDALSDSATTTIDGLGRSYKTQHTVPGNIATVDTTFDLAGHVATVSNPYFSTADTTYGITTNAYDGLDRVTQTIRQDGSVSMVSYDVAAQGVAGNCTISIDEAGKSRRACSDALGRLVEVDEPNSSALGTSAAASVTISGQLNTAHSTTGISPPNAATNSSLNSYFDANGLYHVFYEAANQHIYDIYANGNVAAGFIDLTLEAGSPLAASGSALTFFLDSFNKPHWAYVGTDQRLYLIYQDTGNVYHYVELMSWTGGSPLAVSGSALTSSFLAANYWSTWSYIGTNQHIYMLSSSNTSAPAYTDVTNAAVGAPAAAAGSSLAFFLDSVNTPHWVYVGADQHVYLIYQDTGAVYHYVDMKAWAGNSPLAASGSALTVSFQASNYGQIYSYFGTNQHVYALTSSNTSAPGYTDVTNAAPGAPAAAAGSSLAFFLDSVNTPHWVYLGANQHVYLIYQDTGAAYHYVDMTGWAGNSPLSASAKPLTAAFLATNYQHAYSYLGSNQHVYELYGSNTSTPSFADLNATAPLMATDSGVVSLNVGGFNVTACFGPSTNPSCSAQQTNSSASTVAAALAQSLNVPGSPVSASASGATINMTWLQPGPFTPSVGALSTSHDNSVLFTNASFSSASTTFAGGQGPAFDTTSYATLYRYDALGNLTRVDQKGSAPSDSSQWRTRLFTYDSLSRLLSAYNPESGTITYSYDNDGELLQKTSPAPNPNPPQPTQTVSYCYDELHRVTGRGYGAQSCPLTTPVVSYVYDSGANAKGHLTSMADQAGTASYGYDILGRLTTETRTLIGANNGTISKSIAYSYNLDGSVKTLTYPSNKVITYTPDSAGRTLSAVDSGSGINYVTGATYGPDSGLTGFVSGNSGTFAGITNVFSYNKRLQPVNMSAAFGSPVQTVFNINYDFHAGNGTAGNGMDNGNVWGITNNKDTTRNQAFTYDPLNRLSSAQNAGTDCNVSVLGGNKKFWGNTYGYDAWGNLTNKTKIPTACAGEGLSVTADAQNRIHATGTPDYQYDAAGNMTFNATPPTQTYTYDQENRLTGAAGYTYTYDGDGNRVRKSNGNLAANGTLYWEMTPGVVAETDLAGTTKSEYVFFDGERVARRDGATGTGGVFYYFSDHLKTASVITDSAGVIKAESDYYPWGGELQFVNNDPNDYKFTGKKNDLETGLYYFGARYYSNGLGRWVSADWSATPVPVPYASFGDPQSLNLYGYTRNLPTTTLDPDGHCPPCWMDRLPEDKKGDFGEALKGAWNRFVTLSVGVFNLASDGKVGFAPGGQEQLQPQNSSQRLGAQGMDAVLILAPVIGEEITASRAVTQIVDMTSAVKARSVIQTGTRYVGAGEAAVIEQTGMVPNTNAAGVAKQVFYTPESPMSSASAARDAYQLPSTPTHVVELDTSGIHNTYGGNVENGNGVELITHDKIPATKVTKLPDEPER